VASPGEVIRGRTAHSTEATNDYIEVIGHPLLGQAKPAENRHESVTELSFSSLSRGHRVLFLQNRSLPGIFDSAGFGSVEFRIGLEFSGDIPLSVNSLDRTLRHACRAINAIVGMDHQLIVHFVKAGDGTDLHAISEFAIDAFVGNDVCHKV